MWIVGSFLFICGGREGRGGGLKPALCFFQIRLNFGRRILSEECTLTKAKQASEPKHSRTNVNIALMRSFTYALMLDIMEKFNGEVGEWSGGHSIGSL